LVANVVAELQARLPGITVTEVDLAVNPEAAVRYRVMAAPAIAINGRLEFAGTPSAAALRERLETRWREARGGGGRPGMPDGG
jgi:hypothetical protein